jgi:hypothetical protein
MSRTADHLLHPTGSRPELAEGRDPRYRKSLLASALTHAAVIFVPLLLES